MPTVEVNELVTQLNYEGKPPRERSVLVDISFAMAIAAVVVGLALVGVVAAERYFADRECRDSCKLFARAGQVYGERCVCFDAAGPVSLDALLGESRSAEVPE